MVKLKNAFKFLLLYICEVIIKKLETTDKENISDGYHTFGELYEFRKAYNAALFNEWATRKVNKAVKYNVHKSLCHNDGEACFGGGWFVVCAILPTGQITNHYELKYWDDFKIPVAERMLVEFDGHTAEDVLERLTSL